jgi:hypothetical protein
VKDIKSPLKSPVVIVNTVRLNTIERKVIVDGITIVPTLALKKENQYQYMIHLIGVQ